MIMKVTSGLGDNYATDFILEGKNKLFWIFSTRIYK